MLADGGGNGAGSSPSNGLHVNGAAHQTGMYGSFDDFLMTLKQSKRKAIRQVSWPRQGLVTAEQQGMRRQPDFCIGIAERLSQC